MGKIKPMIGEHKFYQLTDSRGVRYNPFNISPTMPMVNPVTWTLYNGWEDGFYLFDNMFEGMERQTLIQVKDGQIVEGYRLTKLEKGEDLIY